MVSYAEVKSYLSKREIPQLFESLMAGLMYHRPENHIGYLQTCLEEVKTAEDPSNLQWSMFVSGKKRKSKELPPVTPKKQEILPWTDNSRQSTPLPPISAKSRGPHSRYREAEGHRNSLRSTYILYHNPPPMLTPPTVPVVFILGGLGCKIDTLCEEVVGRLRGVVHISTCSMLKTRMTIEGFYRTTSVPACAVVDSVLQAMSMVQSARAMLVAGFPRNRGDIEEYRSRLVRMDGVVLVDFEEESLRTFLDSEVESGIIKVSEVEFELDRYKQDLISVAEYYDEKDLLTVVMGDQETNDIINDLVIAVDKVVETRSQISVEESLAATDGTYQRCKSNGPCAALEGSPTLQTNGDNEQKLSKSVDETSNGIINKIDVTLHNVSNLSLIIMFGNPKVGLKSIKSLIAKVYMMKYIDFNLLMERSQYTNGEKLETNQETGYAPVNDDLAMYFLKKEMLMHISTVRGFLISGFPRNVEEAERFEKEVGTCDAVLLFENVNREKFSPQPNKEVLSYFEEKIKVIQDPEVNISEQVIRILNDIVSEKGGAVEAEEASEPPQFLAPTETSPNESSNEEIELKREDQVASTDVLMVDTAESVATNETSQELTSAQNDIADEISSNVPTEQSDDGNEEKDPTIKTSELLENDETKAIFAAAEDSVMAPVENVSTNDHISNASEDSVHELQGEILPERGKETPENDESEDVNSEKAPSLTHTLEMENDAKKALLIRQHTFSTPESPIETADGEMGLVKDEDESKINSADGDKMSEIDENSRTEAIPERSQSKNDECDLSAEESFTEVSADEPRGSHSDIGNGNEKSITDQTDVEKNQSDSQVNSKNEDHHSEMNESGLVGGTVEHTENLVDKVQDEAEKQNSDENLALDYLSEEKQDSEEIKNSNSEFSKREDIENEEANENNDVVNAGILETMELDDTALSGRPKEEKEEFKDEPDSQSKEVSNGEPMEEPIGESNSEPKEGFNEIPNEEPNKELHRELNEEPNEENKKLDEKTNVDSNEEQNEQSNNESNVEQGEELAEMVTERIDDGIVNEEVKDIQSEEENKAKDELVELRDAESVNENDDSGNTQNIIDKVAEVLDSKSNESKEIENVSNEESDKNDNESQGMGINDDPLLTPSLKEKNQESIEDIEVDDADTIPSITLISEVAPLESAVEVEEIDNQSIKGVDDESLSHESGNEREKEELNSQSGYENEENVNEKSLDAESEEMPLLLNTETSGDQNVAGDSLENSHIGEKESELSAVSGNPEVRELLEEKEHESGLGENPVLRNETSPVNNNSAYSNDGEEKNDAGHLSSDCTALGDDGQEEVECNSTSTCNEGNQTNSDLDTVERQNQSNHERSVLIHNKSQEDSLSTNDDHADDSSAYIVSSRFISSGKMERGDLHRNGSDLMTEGESSRDQREEPQERSSSSSRGEL